MQTSNIERENLIDMSSRSQIEIISPSQSEIEDQLNSFNELNKLIDYRIKKYKEDLNAFIMEDLNKSEWIVNFEQNRNIKFKFNNFFTRRKLAIILICCFSIFPIFLLYNTLFKTKIDNKTVCSPPEEEWIECEEPELSTRPNDDLILMEPYEENINTTELKFNSTIIESISKLNTEEYNNNNFISTTTEIVAQNVLSGKEYTVEQLSGKRLLIPYEENNKEVYFLGQFNEKGHWNGLCTTNIYNMDNTLYGIFRYHFNDGICNNYMSFYKSSEINEWIYVSKTCDDNNVWSGNSIRFLFEGEIKSSFNMNTVNENDIIDIYDIANYFDDFYILSYYEGNFSEGTYNDTSGDAFLVLYFEPDTIESFSTPVIRTFYNGKFENGDFKEEEYDSWYITRSENTKYMFFKGCFEGKTVKHEDINKEEFNGDLTHEEIDIYLEKYGFSRYSNQFITEYEYTNKKDTN